MKNTAKMAEVAKKIAEASKGAKKPKVAKVIPIKGEIEGLCEAICKLLNESDYNGDATIEITIENCSYEVKYEETVGPGDDDEDVADEDEDEDED